MAQDTPTRDAEQEEDQVTEELKKILLQLGIGPHYRGRKSLICAVQLALEDEDRLEAVTKEIYREVAGRLDCTWWSVERNIHTIVYRAWKSNRRLLMDLAGRSLEKVPTATELIEILVNYFQRGAGFQPAS